MYQGRIFIWMFSYFTAIPLKMSSIPKKRVTLYWYILSQTLRVEIMNRAQSEFVKINPCLEQSLYAFLLP